MPKNKLHLLIKHAKTYRRFSGSLEPEGCDYNFQIGAWMIKGTQELLVESADPPKPPQTKKADIETGEDQKGE